jgi:hypothetical protein
MELALDPPAVCCGRELRVRRALEAHECSHGACGEAGCTFAGSRAVLWQHAWEAHGIGSAPKTAPVRGGSTLHVELCAGRAGNEFKIVDELPAEAVPPRGALPRRRHRVDSRRGGSGRPRAGGGRRGR